MMGRLQKTKAVFANYESLHQETNSTGITAVI